MLDYPSKPLSRSPASRSSAPLHVLIIDDDPDTCANLCDILEMDHCQVETAGTIAEALRRDNWSELSAVILDRHLPDGKADQILPLLAARAPDAAILIVTGYSDLEGVISALRQGAADYILKPINPEALRVSLARVAQQQQLRRTKERTELAFRTLVEAAPCMIVILRADATILYFSAFAEELTGYSAQEILGKDYLSLFIQEKVWVQRIRQEMDRILSGSTTRGFENAIRCKDGSVRWMIWNAQRLNDHEGGPAILAVGQDLTASRQAQEQLLQAERLAAIGQMVTGLAHESGNALARSRACLEMLAWEVQDRPEALDLIGRILKAQEHLQQLYEEVRTYATPLRLQREDWDLSAIWRQAWENLALARENKAASLREEKAGVDLRCVVDPFRLDQVFRNVFENSLAACPEPVEISIHCEADSIKDQPAVRIRITDNGPGLSTEQKQRIFEPFFTTKTRGTGLGMAIAKRIVEAHGGQIAVGQNDNADAATGPGAEIIITLPREVP